MSDEMSWIHHLTRSGFMYAVERDRCRHVFAKALSGPDMYDGLRAMFELQNRDNVDPSELKQLSKEIILRQMTEEVVLQMALSRMVDNFLAYLTDIATEVYLTDPSRIPNAKQGAATGCTPERISEIAEERVYQLTRSTLNLVSLLDELSLPRPNKWATIQRLIMIRNLIVHRRGMVSHYYKKHTGTHSPEVGDYIGLTSEQINCADRLLTQTVCSIDESAAAVHGLRRGEPYDLPDIPPRLGEHARLLGCVVTDSGVATNGSS